jgi:3-oxoacyl-[acyl-carrier protein] reductase
MNSSVAAIKENEKIALVTGASRGIGRAIAFALAAEGYQLYIVSSNSACELKLLSEELTKNYGISCTAITCDVSDFSQVELLFSNITNLSLLINNAGISYVGLLSEMSVSDWSKLIQTNLSSAFYCSKLAIPLMLKKKSGRILTISSVWGNVGASCEVAYSAAKGGIHSFTKALAKELAPSNIQVNAIACGMIDTSMNQFLDEAEKKAILEDIPSDRFGSPAEVAELVVQLATSPSYLTGQIITLDGAWI